MSRSGAKNLVITPGGGKTVRLLDYVLLPSMPISVIDEIMPTLEDPPPQPSGSDDDGDSQPTLPLYAELRQEIDQLKLRLSQKADLDDLLYSGAYQRATKAPEDSHRPRKKHLNTFLKFKRVIYAVIAEVIASHEAVEWEITIEAVRHHPQLACSGNALKSWFKHYNLLQHGGLSETLRSIANEIREKKTQEEQHPLL